MNDNQNYLRFQQAQNQELKYCYKAALKLTTRFLQRCVQKRLRQAYSVWGEFVRSERQAALELEFERKTKKILSLKEALQKLEIQTTILEAENQDMKETCLEGQEMSKVK